MLPSPCWQDGTWLWAADGHTAGGKEQYAPWHIQYTCTHYYHNYRYLHCTYMYQAKTQP